MKTFALVIALGLATVASGCSTQERSRNLGDPSVPGRVLAVQVCSNCHGAEGNSLNPVFPRLAGQKKEYLLAQLKAFHDQTRKTAEAHDYMWGLTRNLDDKAIDELAEYFSAQRPAPGQPGDTGLAAKGKAIFEQGISARNVPACASCHGQHAEGNLIFPRLAGQHGSYLIKQIRVFHTDQRPNSGVIMQNVVTGLDDAEATSVAAYLQGL